MERGLELLCLIAIRECQSRSKMSGHGIPEAQSHATWKKPVLKKVETSFDSNRDSPLL